jgi:hypothetical protein
MIIMMERMEKCRTEKGKMERKTLERWGQRDDVIRKNYFLQDSREFL